MATKAAPTAEDLFGDLTLEDKKAQPSLQPTPANRTGPPPPRGENMPPPGRRGPPPGHRPSRSQEEALRARRRENGSNSGISPQRRLGSRPRRNSESSVADPEKPLTEEEKKARELRRQERERRHREKREKPKTNNKKLDLIDRLDATSIFGTGLFHHDGPFDAVNPHRNKNGRRNAPMQAFPKDSLNMSIGGSGPLNKRPDHATFMGKANDEAFTDYSAGVDKAENPQARPKGEIPVWDPKSRGSILHGDETLGLGTSTFLEGTPAARTAIQRREQESAQEFADGGLQRKKSLAQRIRNINRPPRGDFQSSGRMTNPEGVYNSRRSPTGDYPTSSSVQGERNPFFAEYDGQKGGEQISVRKMGSNARPISPPSPPRYNTLERRSTTDASSPTDDQPKQAGGLLGRMKSLKGPRRPRQASDSQPPPGTAA
ncbi:putative pal1 cell morphology protein [Phaeoacremonium minimum UCRPA7]|uniref:Putative pal1 cell morphology protein n=1 Tax=Phaeoacremonium minimum (strain UCR-PA7) TaxID=1286976 RepID=R8BJP7_PHAM7|nr:putative pal1 cell morphology protein [Phaeoacremonium minimum UCRPA7]EON99550.1 putative pal1 cell morphology protein [Phaeoacremonium minimum UCRPA7]